MTKHLVNAENLRRGDIIHDENGAQMSVFAVEAFTGSTVEVSLCPIDRLDLITNVVCLFNDHRLYVYIPQE